MFGDQVLSFFLLKIDFVTKSSFLIKANKPLSESPLIFLKYINKKTRGSKLPRFHEVILSLKERMHELEPVTKEHFSFCPRRESKKLGPFVI